MTRQLAPAFAALLLAATLAPSSALGQTAAPATSGLEITEVQSGLVAAPEVRVGQVNGKTATMVGGSVGWLTDGRLFIGGAGYVVANRTRNFNMEMLGALVRYRIAGTDTVSLNPGLFLGGGDATITRRYGDLFGTPAPMPMPMDPHWPYADPVTPISVNTQVRVHDSFVVAEPRLNALVSVKPWLHLDVGAGYRFIGDSRWVGRQVRGASGSIAVVFGGGH